jgi:hypothetical protein
MADYFTNYGEELFTFMHTVKKETTQKTETQMGV